MPIYDEHEINVEPRREVSSLDASRKRVIFKSGVEIALEKLILATAHGHESKIFPVPTSNSLTLFPSVETQHNAFFARFAVPIFDSSIALFLVLLGEHGCSLPPGSASGRNTA